MARDRLPELKVVTFSSGSSSRSAITQAHEEIDRMEALVEKLALAHAEILSSVEQKINKLDSLSQEFHQKASGVRTSLQQIRGMVSELDSSARGRMQWTQYQALTTRYGAVIRDFSTEQMKYREKCKQQIRKQMEIMGRTAEDDQVEEMLSKGDLFVGEASPLEIAGARQALDEVRARHRDIEKLEKCVYEVNQLFKEVAALIETQGETITRIETTVANAAEFVGNAGNELDQAEKHRKKARKRKLCIMAALAILVIIIVIIIGSSFR